MKQEIKIKTFTNRLLDLTINNSIDLWLFKEIFIDCKKDYKFYTENWKEFSRIPLSEGIFTEVKELLERYIKK